MSDRFLRHITITTCHQRDSWRHEVDDEIIPPLQALISQFASGRIVEPVAIPGCAGYSLTGRVSGHCMVASVWQNGPPSSLLLSIGVAGRERCGAAVWRTLHQVGLPAGSLLPEPEERVTGEYRRSDPDHQPRAPWCAVTLEDGFWRHLDILPVLATLECGLAWAFLELTSSTP
ncbi:MAG: hypothetical protein IT537_03340 [Hyphomicrobiales bacterium]|nr:hypothetical protein [Hyphomicrobiales bacterium]